MQPLLERDLETVNLPSLSDLKSDNVILTKIASWLREGINTHYRPVFFIVKTKDQEYLAECQWSLAHKDEVIRIRLNTSQGLLVLYVREYCQVVNRERHYSYELLTDE